MAFFDLTQPNGAKITFNTDNILKLEDYDKEAGKAGLHRIFQEKVRLKKIGEDVVSGPTSKEELDKLLANSEATNAVVIQSQGRTPVIETRDIARDKANAALAAVLKAGTQPS